VSAPGSVVCGGCVVLSRGSQRQLGTVRCGGCEEVMSNVSTAMLHHAKGCRELQRLRSLADRAIDRKRRGW